MEKGCEKLRTHCVNGEEDKLLEGEGSFADLSAVIDSLKAFLVEYCKVWV